MLDNEEKGSAELRKWLLDRIGDDDDVIVDDLEQKYGPFYEEQEASLGDCDGSLEFRQLIQHLDTSIAGLNTAAGANKMRVAEGQQKITDGIRECWYGGGTDENGLPHGEGMLKYQNQDLFVGTFQHGVLNRSGKLILANEGRISIEGTWTNGLMNGEMRLQTSNGGWIEGYWKNGVPHGFQREFAPKDFRKKWQLRFFGRFYRGVRRGFCWKGLFGGGFLCGFVHPTDGSFSGSQLAFIYPDFKLAILGQFQDEKLMEGRLCRVVGSRLQDGIRMPTFSEPISPQVFTFENPTSKVLALHPTLPDPWEEQMVDVRPSLLPQGGDGLFARKPIAARRMICYFSGVRLRTVTLGSQNMGHSDYRIRLNADMDLDIPAGMEKVTAYCATLGHKANHSLLANAEWQLVEHPRFGLIRGLSSSQDIQQDQEILVNYQMNLAEAPDWYKLVWLQHQRGYKKASDQSIGRILDRYYEDTGKRVQMPTSESLIIPEPRGVDNLEQFDDE